MLVMLATLLSLSLPFVFQSLDKHELAATEDSITSELLKARVKAQESGRAVEVVVESVPSRIVMRYFNWSFDGEFADGSRPRPIATDRDRRSQSIHADGDSRASSKATGRDTWRAESTLDPCVRVTTIPTVDGPTVDSDATDGAAAPSEPSSRVAVYMPDGSILFAASLFLMHQNGLCSRVSVDPWTGQPAVNRSADRATNDVFLSDDAFDEAAFDEAGDE